MAVINPSNNNNIFVSYENFLQNQLYNENGDLNRDELIQRTTQVARYSFENFENAESLNGIKSVLTNLLDSHGYDPKEKGFVKNDFTQSQQNKDFILKFGGVATTVINKINNKLHPTQLTDPSYHGEVIQEVWANIEQSLAGHGEISTQMIRSHARQYCTHFFELERYENPLSTEARYLLRESSTVRREESDEWIFQPYILSTRRNLQNKNSESHRIIYHITHKNTNLVKWTQSKDTSKFSEGFDTFKEYIEFHLPNASPILKPSLQKRSEYITSYTQVLPPQNMPLSSCSTSSAQTETNKPTIKISLSDCMRRLECPISLDDLEDPVITPQGYSYSRSDLITKNEGTLTDPIANTEFSISDVRSNRLAGKLVQALKNIPEGSNVASIVDNELRDPITNELIQTPVIAPNNITYDRETVMKYLSEHSNELPDGTPCQEKDLYPNRVVQDILNLRNKSL